MKYTPITKTALKICFEAHKDQLDKAGAPYVFHPFHLAERMDTEDEVCVALLHDVVEDTKTTIDDLRDAGMPKQVLEALELMTHADGVPYMDYVARLARNPLARKVKMADLRHNSDLSRLEAPGEADFARVRKYAQALELLAAMSE